MNAMFDFLVIAIDGGAASGKSTTARAIAERLDLMHVDTGSYYRSLCAAMLDKGISPEDPTIRSLLAEFILETQVAGRSGNLLLDGIKPTQEILRSERVTANVSAFAAQPAVREKLLDYQRQQVEVAQENGFAGLVMERRDIGSVIFPDAPVRVFLHANPEIRSRRRADQGETDAIEARDAKDSSRTSAPLTCPEGAFSIDTGNHTLEEVTDRIVQLVETIR